MNPQIVNLSEYNIVLLDGTVIPPSAWRVMAERDAALAVLRQLIAADDAITWAYTGDDPRDPLSAEVAHECAAAEGAFQAALDAARRLLAGQP